MKLLILSRNSNLYSTRRLVEAARAKEHQVFVVDPLRCYMNIASKKPVVYFRKDTLEGFDAIIPRIGASITFYGTAVVRQFEMMRVFSLNESQAITRSRDKLRCLQMLSKKGLGMPITAFAHSTKMTKELINLVGGAPLIIKLLEGTQGRGVILTETPEAAESVIGAFREMEADFLVQEFVKESNGTDIRCFVIGERVVASMKRIGRPGEFRSNLHRGGKGEVENITDEERKMAVTAARTLGLNVAGVDILRSKRGPLIIEVNSSPGLEGIENVTGLDIASKIIQFIERAAFKKHEVQG